MNYLERVLVQATRQWQRGQMFSPLVQVATLYGPEWVRMEYVNAKYYEECEDARKKHCARMAVGGEIFDPRAQARALSAAKQAAARRTAAGEGPVSDLRELAPGGLGPGRDAAEVQVDVSGTEADGRRLSALRRRTRRDPGDERPVCEHTGSVGDVPGVRAPGRVGWDELARQVREGQPERFASRARGRGRK